MLNINYALKGVILSTGLLTTVSFSANLPDFTSLIKKNAPTVVQIDARSSQQSNGLATNGQPIAPDDLLRYFFEGPGGAPHNRIQPKARPSAAHGSGFFIDKSGYILTNAHVVNGSDEITISTTDQTEYEAELIGLDERTDVALLKIKKEGLPAAKIGDSDKAEVGNWVLAIGSPFGFDYTATKGIISAVSRSLPDGTYVPFIQTDAAVNPGNSGGPLFNLNGEVIGINSQIYSSTGSFNGLAFAIPINTAINIAEQLKNKGFVSRGWLGVAIQNVDQNLAKSFGLSKPQGALVSSVVENSPAQEAGIQAGDIIMTFNDKKVKKSSALPPMVGAVEVGEAVDIDVLREGKNKTLSVTIGELDEGNKPQNKPSGASSENHGLMVSKLSQKVKEKVKIDSGIIVINVKPKSRAEDAGFKKGDIIANINNQTINNVKDFEVIMKDLNEDTPAAVLIIRKGRSLFIPL